MSTVRKTVCDFCLNGCNLGVSFDGYQYRIEYITDEGPNYGRLCPRGNSANIVIDHPKRLCYPLLDGKEVSWERALTLIREWCKGCRGDEIAVVYSRGLMESELRMVADFARQLGTENLVCGYLDPDKYLGLQLEGVKRVTLDEVSSARAILLVGDVFSASPVAGGFILNARYADRSSRLVVIDSIRTRQAGFAHLFLQVKPGTEYRALAAIAGILDPKLKLDVMGFARGCGLERSELEEAANILKSTPNGMVGAAASLGRVEQPMLHSLLAQLVALKAGKPFVGFAEALIPEGKLGFQQFHQLVSQGKIRLVFWFGGLYPYSYKEVFPELSNVQFRVATSIFRRDQILPGLVLPVPSEFEKSGEGETLWRHVVREPVARPVSGSRSIREIIKEIAGGPGAEFQWKPGLVRVEELLEMLINSPESEPVVGYRLVGERRAIGIGEFFDSEDEVMVNPVDARQLGLTNGSQAMVKTRTAEQRFMVKVSGAVPAGVLAVGVDAHNNRRLFSVKFDALTGMVTIPPTKVDIWRL